MKGRTNNWLLGQKIERKLRRSMTDAEVHLWSCLRDRRMRGFKFRRQHPFGDFVLDFVCLEKNLVIEVDGGQHADAESDEARTKILNEAGFKVIRFWNNDVLTNFESVKEAIYNALEDGPHP